MSEQRRNGATTPPSKAPGESGDPEARREAEEALEPGEGDGEAGDALSPNTATQKRVAGQEPSKD
ncbi:hypothetical protein [Streptomyces vinaceus]|uniref:hypothetical protein n=1 Tax=Streptomyces vinaceus TaxID=1960 RepID=UPI000C182E70